MRSGGVVEKGNQRADKRRDTHPLSARLRLTVPMEPTVPAPALRRVRSFVLLATRAEDAIAEEEYEAFLRHMDLTPARLRRIRLERGAMPALDLEDVAGVVVGGSPFTSSDPPETKSDVQRRVETEMRALVSQVCARDVPFLGACYGIGTLGSVLGGVVDTTYGEPAGAVTITVTDDGARDPLLAHVPREFKAFVGHKEALRALPPGATLLATSSGAPVQMLRYGRNVYATQFHPELDSQAFERRVRAYIDSGYVDPMLLDSVVARGHAARVAPAHEVLGAFAERYR